MSASKLPQTECLLLPKASTDLEPSTSQSFQKLRVLHQPKAARGKLYSSWICSYMLDLETIWVVATRQRHVAGGGWQPVEIIMSVIIIVWTISLARPPRRKVTMPHSHGLDNYSYRFCRNGRQLGLGESRSLAQIFQQNLLPASHQLWVYVCAFSLGLMVMIAMVMVMAMVFGMVIKVLEVLRQVGWPHQRQHWSLHRLRAVYWPKLP